MVGVTCQHQEAGPTGDGLHLAGGVFADDPPIGTPPPLRTRGIIDPPTWGGHLGLVVGVFDCGPTGRRFESTLCRSTVTLPQWSMTG